MERFKNQHRLTEAMFNKIIDKISNNIGITRACNECGILPEYFRHLLKTDTLFKQEFEDARAFAIDCRVDELYELADKAITPIDLGIAKLKSENARWIASKRARDTYGEKMEVSVHQTLDISRALEAAEARLGPMLDHKKITRDVKPLISNAEFADITTGFEGVVENYAPSKKPESLDDLL